MLAIVLKQRLLQICETKFGSPLIFYVHAAASALVFFAWFVCYSNKPRNTSYVSGCELELIEMDKNAQQINGAEEIPYKVCHLALVQFAYFSYRKSLRIFAFTRFGFLHFANFFQPIFFRPTNLISSEMSFITVPASRVTLPQSRASYKYR